MILHDIDLGYTLALAVFGGGAALLAVLFAVL